MIFGIGVILVILGVLLAMGVGAMIKDDGQSIPAPNDKELVVG